MPEVQDIFQLINSAQSILILIKGQYSISDIKQISSLTSFIKSKGKSFQVYSVDTQDSQVNDIAKELGIDLTQGIKPSEYIVTIDYASSGVEKVVYDTDKENGKLVFKIVPSKAGFSFDNVQFTEGGGKFDGTITIGLDNPQDLRSFYDENEYLFKENQVFKITNAKMISEILSTNISEITPEVANEILKNTIETVNIVEGSPESTDLKNILTWAQLGGNISEAIKTRYYSKPDNYLEMLKLLLENVRTSEDVIYSYVLKADVEKFGLKSFTNIGRLPYNYLKKYDIAFLFIQNTDGIMHLVVQVNDTQKYSAQTIAGVFGGVGDMGHAVTILDSMSIDEVNKRFTPILKDLYNIDLTVNLDNGNVDNLPKVLTKGRRNSKNKGSKIVS
jgi:hypothetical protein